MMKFSMVMAVAGLAGTADAACKRNTNFVMDTATFWKAMDGTTDTTLKAADNSNIDLPYLCASTTADSIEFRFHFDDTASSGATYCGTPTANVDNSCGIHLHTGTCSTPGGHAYDTSLSADPWAAVVYQDATRLSSAKTLTQKMDIGMVANQVWIAHDKAGTKIACRPVAYAGGTKYPLTSTFSKVSTYSGSIAVSHTDLTIGFYPGTGVTKAIFTGKITGDTACNDAFSDDTGNKCGLHLHLGTCAAIGAHAYTSPLTSSTDPFGAGTKQMYVHNEFVANVFDTKFTMAKTKELVVVVHDSTGAKIACMPVQNPATASAASVGVGATTVLALAMALMM